MIIEADRGARMIMVRADDETFTKVQELVAKLDVASVGKSTPTILALKHAQAALIAVLGPRAPISS